VSSIDVGLVRQVGNLSCKTEVFACVATSQRDAWHKELVITYCIA
jgi:hypothetical protein